MTGESPARWLALPQPTTVRLAPGSWHPASARVVTEDQELTAEAERFQRELAAIGCPEGPASLVRLRHAPGSSPEAFGISVGVDIDITADAGAGAFRATRQLLHNLRAQGFVPHGEVHSSPTVPERGLHLDAARKHFPANWIRTLLHEIADVGINTLQWHVSENEGFRIGSETFPEIVSEQHITRAEALGITELAHELHIDVIPSLDMPGHLKHVLAAHPNLRMPDGGGPLSDRALDITNPRAVAFALTLIDDLIPLFPHSTRWHLGGDEFVDFARIDDYPALSTAAHERFGPEASGFDLLTDFVNRVAAHLRAHELAPCVWNDGMLRSTATVLDPGITLTWWTNWHAAMRPLRAAIDAGHDLVNFNDGLLYHVLGENAGYTYPTSQRIWAADWHPGLFPALPDGTRQELRAPYPPRLRGAVFSIWADRPDAQTPEQVRAGIRHPLRAMSERAWNGGSALTHAEFAELANSVGEPSDTICFR